jgi:mannosyltransferase
MFDAMVKRRVGYYDMKHGFVPILSRVARLLIRNRTLLAVVGLALIIELAIHLQDHRVRRPPQNLDEPFARGCEEPNVSGARENATIFMLARNSDRNGAIAAISSLEKQFNRWFHYPIVFLNDEPWEGTFISALSNVASGPVQFQTIATDLWGFPPWIDAKDAKRSIAWQGKRGLIYAGLESYHHMCRFNSG